MEFGHSYETARKTFFWYRVYCASLAVIYLGVAVIGAVLAVVPFDSSPRDREQMFIMGIIYAILGAGFFIIFAVAFFLPPKPYNWIVGIVMLAIGMTSCCFLPFVIPLLIFWVKPETQAFFGRKQPS
jgi:hypothetical protein